MIWELRTGQLIQTISEPHSDTILGLAFSPRGQYLASCGADRQMKVFEVATGRLVCTCEGHTHHVLSVAWRADGRMLATGGADKVVKVWSFPSGEQQKTIEGFAKEITSLQFLGLSDNIVTILDTVKSMTQPDVLAIANNALGVFQASNTKPQKPLGLFGLLRRMRDPEIQAGMDMLLELVRQVARSQNQPTTKE